MIWLASYPRSGNTMLRVILFEVFGLYVGQPHHEKPSRKGPVTQAAVGYGLPNRNDGLIITKTHGAPTDSEAAIYIIRHGLAACVSYMHYYALYQKTVPLEAIIRGNVNFGSWSGHANAWQPLRRPNTLLLYYEEVARKPDHAISALSAFLNREPIGPLKSTFSSLKSGDEFGSKFFRAGNNRMNISEASREHRRLFHELHGPTMREMGYYAWWNPKRWRL